MGSGISRRKTQSRIEKSKAPQSRERKVDCPSGCRVRKAVEKRRKPKPKSQKLPKAENGRWDVYRDCACGYPPKEDANPNRKVNSFRKLNMESGILVGVSRA